MIVKEIYHEQMFAVSQFNNLRVGVTLGLNENEDWDDVFAEAMRLVKAWGIRAVQDAHESR